MRVLILGPRRAGAGNPGSLPPYLQMLASGLATHGARVDWIGSTSLPYDPAADRIWPARRIAAAAADLTGQVRVALDAARRGGAPVDVIAVHAGNLEIEQLTAALVGRIPRDRRPALVGHAHTLAPTLFTAHRPDPALAATVAAAGRNVDGLVCFGDYARTQLGAQLRAGTPVAVVPLPTTIPAGTAAATAGPVHDALRALAGDAGPLITLYGYAAPWKDAATLLAALPLLTHPARVLLAGPLWDDPAHAGVLLPAVGTTAAVGRARLRIVPHYLAAADRRALVDATDLGVFPYRPHPAFQGSGAIADYLAAGVPVLAADVANMAELLGPAGGRAGGVIAAADPAGLAAALHDLTRPAALTATRAAARRRASTFTAIQHARGCLDLYTRATA